MDEQQGVAEALRATLDEIAGAARARNRDPHSVRLIAVTKTVPGEGIEAAIAAGQRLFGENRVQEAKAKWPALKERHPEIELHLIGPLQSNKVREAVELFDVIHSVDRPKIARALARRDGAERQISASPRAGEHRRGAAKSGRYPDARRRPSSRSAATHTDCRSKG